jgi:hypothetical protein
MSVGICYCERPTFSQQFWVVTLLLEGRRSDGLFLKQTGFFACSNRSRPSLVSPRYVRNSPPTFVDPLGSFVEVLCERVHQ